MTTDASRLRTLRYIRFTTSDADLKDWAKGEETLIDAPVEAVRAKVVSKNNTVQSLTAKLGSTPTEPTAEKAALQTNLARAIRERDQLLEEQEARERALQLPSPTSATSLIGRKVKCWRATNKTVELSGDLDGVNAQCAGQSFPIAGEYENWNDGSVSVATNWKAKKNGASVWCSCFLQP